VRLQLLLLGAIAAVVALTMGAVSLTGSVPAASLSTLPAAATARSPEAAPTPEVVAAATPATVTATAITDTSTTAVEATVEPAASTTPAACTAAIQLAQAGGGRKGPARAVIASAIADCFGQLPAASQVQIKSSDPGSGHGAGGDSGG
jgi:hypothetical protein